MVRWLLAGRLRVEWVAGHFHLLWEEVEVSMLCLRPEEALGRRLVEVEEDHRIAEELLFWWASVVAVEQMVDLLHQWVLALEELQVVQLSRHCHHLMEQLW